MTANAPQSAAVAEAGGEAPALGVVTRIRDDVLEIRLDRPEKLNPVGAAEWDAIVQALDAAERNPAVRAVVIRSQGRYFCAGNDLRAMLALRTRDEYLDYFCGATLRGFIALLTSPLPVICAIHAPTAGGGLELAMYSDYCISSEEAHYSLPEPRRGLYASTLVAAVPYAWPRSTLAALAYTGEPVSAERARSLGLVHEVVPTAELDSAVERALAGVRAGAPDAVAATKAHLNEEMVTHGIPAVRRALETLVDLLVDGNGAAGLASFVQKTQPEWNPDVPGGYRELRTRLEKDYVRGEAR